MKRHALASVILCSAAVLAQAQARAPQATPPPPPEPPPVFSSSASPAAEVPVYVYDQKPVSGRSYLIAPEQAQSIITRFKEEYKKMGNPRLLIYVNRELIDESSGVKLTSHKRVLESTRSLTAESGPAGAGPDSHVALPQTERAVSTNIYRMRDRKEPSLADKQTVRDVERLIGRPLRMAGATLVDQRIANQVLGGRTLDSFSIAPDGEQARKERDALAKTADVVLEVLISSKETTVTELSGDRIYSAPDIQVTAVRLSDSKILGQATAADLIGQGPSAGRAARTYGIREISEATSLSLMEDIMLAPN